MGKVASGGQVRLNIAASEKAALSALGAMAAVIEEPHCRVGAGELKQLVTAYGRLYRSVFGERGDYRFVDGAAVDRAGRVIKRPLDLAIGVS